MNRRDRARVGRARQRADKKIKNLQRRISSLNPRGGCKIPSLPDEPEETNNLQGCHLISVSAYLMPIATQHHVMHWGFDPRAIANSVMNENTLAYTRLTPTRTPTRKCTSRYACNWHDNRLFEEIDNGALDPGRVKSPDVV